MKITSEYIMCECHSEILYIEYDESLKQADLCIYHSYDYGSKLSWKNRIRYCWKIISTGKPYSDHMIMYRRGLRKLKNILVKIKI
jgi:hypothetical protein